MVQLFLVIVLLIIFYQDWKARRVLWYLFPLAGIGFGWLHYSTVGGPSFLWSSIINIGIIGSIVLLLHAYVKIRFSVGNLFTYFGLGDVLFLLILAIGFPTITFLTLFVITLLGTLIIHRGVLWFTLSRKRTATQQTTVPLAGYLALIYTLILCVHWAGWYQNLYSI